MNISEATQLIDFKRQLAEACQCKLNCYSSLSPEGAYELQSTHNKMSKIEKKISLRSVLRNLIANDPKHEGTQRTLVT